MKAVLLLMLAAALRPAFAEKLECPRTLDGKELRLVSAYFDKQTQIHGDQRLVKGGFVVGLPLNVKWLVCDYDGGSTKWIPVKDGERSKTCSMAVTEGKRGMTSGKLTCQ
jgi:hypothetical protein